MTGMDEFQEAAFDAERDEAAFAVEREDVAGALEFAAGLVRGLEGLPPSFVEVKNFEPLGVSLLAGRESSPASLAGEVFGRLPVPEFYASTVSYSGEVDGYRVKVYGAASAKDRARLLRAELAELEAEAGVA